uniref:F-box domain-containing protein n=1 Tax=Oryza glumipatula TaxID=40148 RepID=A0A0D9YG72_9ORYZ
MSEPLHWEARRGMREPTTPPWGALPIVVPFLDPKSLAAASCVCTSWSAAFGADGLWFPSALGLLHLLGGAEARGPHSSPHRRRLFGLFHAASHGQQVKPPRLPSTTSPSPSTSSGPAATPSSPSQLPPETPDPRTFGVDTSDRNAALLPGERWSVRLTAVRAGAGLAPTAFVMVYAENKEMPAPPHHRHSLAWGAPHTWLQRARHEHSGGGGGDHGEHRGEPDYRPRFVSIDDGLRYLQQFLL